MAQMIGLYGGSFDPPHLGHLACIKVALQQLELQRLAVVPTAQSPHKRGLAAADAEQRLAMCHLAFDGIFGVEVSELELQRGGVSYTVDTLAALERLYPDAEFTLVLGRDAAISLPSWHQPQQILERVTLAVVARQGDSRVEVDQALSSVDGVAKVTHLEIPPVAVSSSQIRQLVAEGVDVSELLPPGVYDYILSEQLYLAR